MVDFRDSPPRSAPALVAGRRRLARSPGVFRRCPQALADRRRRGAAAAGPARDRRRDGEPAGAALPGDRRRACSPRLATGRRRPAAARPSRIAGPTRLRWVLAATLVLYAIQASYSEDVSNAVENIGFFLVPFAVLFVPARRGRVDARAAAPGADRGRRGRRRPARWSRSASTSPATCSSTPSSSTPTSCTSTSASTRSSSTPTSSAATWRWRSRRSAACIAWGGDAPRARARRGGLRASALVGARVQLLDHQLRRPARRPRHRRDPALGLARASPRVAALGAGRRWSRW